MKKYTGSFQEKLKISVINRLIILIGAGVILLAVGMVMAVLVTHSKNARDNGSFYEERFHKIYRDGSAFLRGEALQNLCLGILLYEKDTSALPYLIYEFNATSPVNAKLVLNDKERNILFNSYSEQEWDLYKNVFNKAICANAFLVPYDRIYSSVYYFKGEYSSYVMSKPVYYQGRTIGYINLYFDGSDWEQYLSEAEYEGIITDTRGRVIFSSRQSFITGINKFVISSPNPIVYINGRRYWCNRRFLNEENVIIYSLIYYPKNNPLIITAFVIIAIIGFSWYRLAKNMMDAMAKSNASSINHLLSEIKIISQGNSEHRIRINTEDEFSIVGVHINQMLDNIHELNEKNTELLRINNITEINHLTAQINPHFLYNTLEIIRNLLVFDNRKADNLIIKLTQILRYSINSSRKYVYLEEDMAYIRDYLDIQKTRFEENLHFDINIDEECNKCIIPKLLLQPIICICHP